ncbi:MAG: hypothetical protein K0R52_1154 [Alphaproteobacteria bacterium]|nr:hypothetical protein [Alphaproteobacteria bacterium]
MKFNLNANRKILMVATLAVIFSVFMGAIFFHFQLSSATLSPLQFLLIFMCVLVLFLVGLAYRQNQNLKAERDTRLKLEEDITFPSNPRGNGGWYFDC